VPGQVSLNSEASLGEPIAAQGVEEFLPLTSQGYKKNSTVTKGTLPVPSSLSSTKRNLETSTDSIGILCLGQCKHRETTLGPLPQVREDTESSTSALPTLEPLADSTGILELGQCKHTETTSGPLPLVRENTESSTSALPTLGPLPPSPREPGRLLLKKVQKHSLLVLGT
jgi:hypothetical protein